METSHVESCASAPASADVDRAVSFEGRALRRRWIGRGAAGLAALAATTSLVGGGIVAASAATTTYGTQTLLHQESPAGQPEGLAVDDATGDVYYTDFATGDVYEIPASTGVPVQDPAFTNLGKENSYGIAVDNTGDVFVTSSSEVLEQLAGTNIVVTIATEPVTANTTDYSGIAVDSATGDLYVASPAAGGIFKLTPNAPGADTYTPSLLAIAGIPFPYSVAVDGAGDVFVSDPITNDVVELTAGGTQSTVLTGLTASAYGGVAVDSSGDLFVVNNGAHDVVEVLAANLSATATPSDGTVLPFTFPTAGGPQANEPDGLAVDGSGNVFLADNIDSQILEMSPTVAAPAPVVTATTVPSAPAPTPAVATPGSSTTTTTTTSGGTTTTTTTTVTELPLFTHAQNGSPGSKNTFRFIAQYVAHVSTVSGVADSGSVAFMNDGHVMCRAQVSAGTATCTSRRATKAALLVISAIYTGNSTYASTKSHTTMRILRAPVTILLNRRTTAAGRTLYIADVRPVPAGGAVPRGTVVFRTATNVLCVARLHNELATCLSSIATTRYSAVYHPGPDFKRTTKTHKG